MWAGKRRSSSRNRQKPNPVCAPCRWLEDSRNTLRRSRRRRELNKQVCGNCYNYEHDGFVFVDELGESAITVGLRAWVATENYWPVKWKMNERIKEEFDAAGISIPYNQLDVHICPEPANKKAGKGDK